MALENRKLESWQTLCPSCDAIVGYNHIHCPKCKSDPDKHEIRNYDPMFRDGDVHCTLCNTYVRGYDAG